MKKCFARWLLFKVLHYRAFNDDSMWPNKCIIVLAPHTSNWDFIIGQLYQWTKGEKCNFLMKKEWFFWPMGILMRHLGGIPVFRSKSCSMTDSLAASCKERSWFRLCITPEGTRKPTQEWKKGFFFIAQKSGIPILPFALDFEKRTITRGVDILPTAEDNVEEVMSDLKTFFKGVKGKHPEKFLV